MLPSVCDTLATVNEEERLLIVIEGPDLCGKTSLARRIGQLVRGEVRHAGPPSRCSIEEYETALDAYDPRSGEHLILDRWHVGEYVWPRIFGRDSDFDVPTQRHVEMFMRSRGAVIVYASRDPDKLKVELVEENEPLTPDKLDESMTLFAEARRLGRHDSYGWDYEYSTQADVIEVVEAALHQSRVVRPMWDALDGGGFVIGSQVPTVLLVGDELGPEKDGRTPPNDIPFAPYPATSGHYLLRALRNWHRYAIVNSKANRSREPRDLVKVCRAFKPSAVVALGKNASKELTSAGVSHQEVPHPQYWRRFKHAELDEYTRLIEEAASAAD